MVYVYQHPYVLSITTRISALRLRSNNILPPESLPFSSVLLVYTILVLVLSRAMTCRKWGPRRLLDIIRFFECLTSEITPALWSGSSGFLSLFAYRDTHVNNDLSVSIIRPTETIFSPDLYLAWIYPWFIALEVV